MRRSKRVVLSSKNGTLAVFSDARDYTANASGARLSARASCRVAPFAPAHVGAPAANASDMRIGVAATARRGRARHTAAMFSAPHFGPHAAPDRRHDRLLSRPAHARRPPA